MLLVLTGEFSFSMKLSACLPIDLTFYICMINVNSNFKQKALDNALNVLFYHFKAMYNMLVQIVLIASIVHYKAFHFDNKPIKINCCLSF